jgi:hypothetical protein
MDKSTSLSVQRAIAWCGPLFVISYSITFGIMGHNIPPPNMMGMTPDQLISEYYGKYPEIGLGMILAAFAGLLYLPWSCLLANLLREEDGSHGVLSYLELSGGLLTAWLLAFCPAIWAACSMLVDSVAPDTIKIIHTFTWFIFDCTYMITTIQLAGLGLYTVLNKKQTMFPAWSGWCALAVGAIFLPLTVMPFVSEGPFKISGLWNFFIVFGTWLFCFFSVYSYYMLRHLYRAESAHALGAESGSMRSR